MSGLYLLALIAIWLLAGWGIYRGWRRWKPVDLKRKVFHVTIGVLLFSLWFGGAFWEVAGKKMYWDAKVRELCAKDGGITVYETVELPAERFNRWGQPNFYNPTEGENALGKEYLFKRDIHFYRDSDPKISRRSYKVVRRSDSKLLGESVIYWRAGGDLRGPWFGSGFHCPDEGGDLPLFVRIFQQSNKE